MKRLKDHLHVPATTLMIQIAVLGVTGVVIAGLYHGYRFAKNTLFDEPIDLHEYEV
jgi:hypothetical protein